MPEDESAVSRGLQRLSLGRPPEPRIISSGIVMTDITERFISAASTLQPGELVKDGYFTLFEAVGALEIMDPKMDSGCVPDEELGNPDYQLTRPLLPAEVLGIIDQLLSLEMAWHLGYPLSQTLFTSMYLTGILIPTPPGLVEADFVRGRSPEELRRLPTHLVLRAYCISLIKTCTRTIESVSNEVFFEDEDFSTNTFHLPLLEDVNDEETRQVLEEARAAVLDASHGWAEDVSLALEARLEFRDAFFTAMELAELRVQPDALKVPWLRMTAAVEHIKNTHALGTPVPDSFNIKMQSMLASTMPPRPIVQPSFEEACQQWSRLAEDGAESVGVLAYTDPQSLLNFVLTFLSKKPQPLAYIRTLVQSLIFADNIMLGSLSIRQVMDDDLAILVLPCSPLLDPANDEIEVVTDPRFVLAQKMEDFRQRAFPAYLDIYRALCQNRSRARRMMFHILQEWERVQVDAEDIDKMVQPELDKLPADVPANAAAHSSEGAPALPLSSWAFLYKLQLMEWVVQLGFELEIYQADELAGMYWYLCYLAKRRVQHAERIRSFTVRSLNEQRRLGQGTGTGRHAFTATHEAEFTRSLLYLRMTLLGASVTWELADALSCLYAVLQRSGLLKGPARPYGTDELRYELRMRPFAYVGLPELPPFATFKAESEQADSSVGTILAYAEQALAGAKKGCEALARFDEREAFAAGCHARWLAGTKNMHKSAILAGIAVAALKKEVERAEKSGGGGSSDEGAAALKLLVEVPPPDKRYHDWWIVPKITAQK